MFRSWVVQRPIEAIIDHAIIGYANQRYYTIAAGILNCSNNSVKSIDSGGSYLRVASFIPIANKRI